MGILKRWSNKRKKKFLSNCRQEFIDLYNKKVTISERNVPKRCNSYESNLLMTLWSNEYLIQRAKYYLSNSSNKFRKTDEFTIDGSYDEALTHKIIHMLVERLEKI